MSPGGTVRAFLAVASDPLWVASARDLLARVRAVLPDASWTRPESWHLTIRFLGETLPDTVEAFANGVDPLASGCGPGALQAGEPAVFPTRGPARVLGVGFRATPGLEELRRLAAGIESVARLVGAEREDRPFHPHVTFARVRNPWPRAAVDSFRDEVSGWSFPPWPLRACVLYTSRLSPTGAVHTPLREWEVAGAGRVPA